MSVPSCHLCGQDALHEIDAYRRFKRITSDFRLWPAGGRLAVCGECGAVQKMATADWRRECQAIYASYVVYPQGNGSEQAVFASSGAGEARSRSILRRLLQDVGLGEVGRHLDFGCGDGSLLRNAASLMPGWSRAGAELNDSQRPEIEAIAGVHEFFAGDPSAIPTDFDLVSTIHVLEHFERPAASVAMLTGKLTGAGILMIQTPDVRHNPFDLLIADHATHFTPAVLRACLAEAGASVDRLADNWVPRELSVVARRGTTEQPVEREAWQETLALSEGHLDWLDRLCAAVHRAAESGPIGLFGTSIAATWLFGQAEHAVAFFVDEDPLRAGSIYLGRPVLHPWQVPSGARVFIAHTPAFAEGVSQRLCDSGRFDVLHPPPLATPS